MKTNKKNDTKKLYLPTNDELKWLFGDEWKKWQNKKPEEFPQPALGIMLSLREHGMMAIPIDKFYAWRNNVDTICGRLAEMTADMDDGIPRK